MIVLPEIDPVAVHLGPLAVRWYGLAYAVGFLAAWLLGRARAARPWSRLSPTDMDDLLTWLVIGLVLGGRLGYALFYNLPHYLEEPADVLRIWHGGMSFHGGLLGVLAASWLFARRRGLPFLAVGDFLAPLTPPGLFFGRLGNFVNAELWGRPTDQPWGMVFPTPSAGPLPRHPSQLYEAGLEGLLLFAVLWWYSRKPRPTGAVGGLFLAGYGLCRFAVEFAREPDPQLGYLAWGWLTMGMVLCLPMVLAGAALLLRAARRADDCESSF
ncbi:MAG: prolipoprotein diacylglyceryl transferase [Desulfovibrionaceae bacterium]